MFSVPTTISGFYIAYFSRIWLESTIEMVLNYDDFNAMRGKIEDIFKAAVYSPKSFLSPSLFPALPPWRAGEERSFLNLIVNKNHP